MCPLAALFREHRFVSFWIQTVAGPGPRFDLFHPNAREAECQSAAPREAENHRPGGLFQRKGTQSGERTSPAIVFALASEWASVHRWIMTTPPGEGRIS